jgi:hypothetical protein
MIDRTTKIIMAAIAFGLWANAAISLFGPARADAQNSGLRAISSNVVSIGFDLSKIASGSCKNSKIC